MSDPVPVDWGLLLIWTSPPPSRYLYRVTLITFLFVACNHIHLHARFAQNSLKLKSERARREGSVWEKILDLMSWKAFKFILDDQHNLSIIIIFESPSPIFVVVIHSFYFHTSQSVGPIPSSSSPRYNEITVQSSLIVGDLLYRRRHGSSLLCEFYHSWVKSIHLNLLQTG